MLKTTAQNTHIFHVSLVNFIKTFIFLDLLCYFAAQFLLPEFKVSSTSIVANYLHHRYILYSLKF